MNELISSFVPKQARALASVMENDIMSVGPDNQTASDLNDINGGYHRFVAGGTNETITIEDFAKARYALQIANVPMRNLVAIVDTTVEYALATQPNLINFSNPHPQWTEVMQSGITRDNKFLRNIEGFDVYSSLRLKKGTSSETINSVTASAPVYNLFFSADSVAQPFIGLIRQAPKVDYEYNKDYQRDEYVTTCRYGFDLYREESLVVILTDTDQVYA